jgi:hypothetical protein
MRKPLTEKEFEKILGLISDWNVETSSSEIDEVLYGSSLVASRPHRRIKK